MATGTLYLLPTFLGESDANYSFPNINQKLTAPIRHFIVEKEKTARRFLRKAGYTADFDEVELFPLNKRTTSQEYLAYIKPLLEGEDMGLMSEAGCPGVADPGAEIVKIAHQKNIRVVPLIGPSSILLGLMGSGLNGQSFTFHGYLPKESGERIRKLKTLEKESQRENRTHILIETPYRNLAIFDDMIKTLRGDTLLCVACDLSTPNEYLKTLRVEEWKKVTPPIQKRPTVFLFLG